MHLELLLRKGRLYKKVFLSQDGKKVLSDLYKVAKINSLSYVENSSDKTAFNEGAKYMVKYIQKLLNQNDLEVSELLDKNNNNNNI